MILSLRARRGAATRRNEDRDETTRDGRNAKKSSKRETKIRFDDDDDDADYSIRWKGWVDLFGILAIARCHVAMRDVYSSDSLLSLDTCRSKD